MPDPTLLQVVRERLSVSLDPDSDGGQILNSLTLAVPLAAGALTGKAKADGLALALSPSGVSIRAAQNSDAVVLRYPPATFDFTLVPRDAAHPDPLVELQLTQIDVPLPFLHPAQETSPDTLKSMTTGKVELALPPLLLVIRATTTPPASVHLSPFHGGVQDIPVTFKPAFASIDRDCVVGLHIQSAKLKLGAAPQVLVERLKLYIAPPGIPALAMAGSAQNLSIGLSAGTGLSGEFKLALAGGAAAPMRPRFLRRMEAQLELNHSTVTRLELSGQIATSEEVHAHFSAIDASPEFINYNAALRLDPIWEISLALSGSGGNNFLWRKGRTNVPLANDALDTLGAFAVLAPLLDPIATAGVGSLAGSQVFKTRSLTLVGGELQILENAGGSREARLFFELETELELEIPEISIKSSRPIKVRHRALGVKLDFGSNGANPRFHPIIDPAQGFALDLSDPGLFEMPTLGDLLKPDGTRIAKENPLLMEIDLVSKANLGVVTIDRASVRVPLIPPGTPSLTALGAHLDAGLVTGGGYLKIMPDGFEGRLDVSLGMLGVRGGAGLKLIDKGGIVALAATLEVEWPIPIPLATSGLGLFGLVGLFAMHMRREQPASESTLAWFLRAGGDPTKLAMWGPNEGSWAFGAGAILGTLEGGFIIHAKGMLMIELPGPRILIVMNADILKKRPGVKGAQELATILALIEITPHSLTIALILDYRELKPLLQVRIPVEAFFNFDDSEDWRLDVGGIPPEKRVLVKFLDSFRADGYFLIHGNGILDFKPPLHGFAIAVGVHVAFTWGPKSIGLYMTVAFEAQLGIGFKPFLLAGKAGMSGELHLFILSLGVSATAEILIARGGWQLKAEVCARVEFLFFDVEGCVTLELGDPPPLPPADPLVSALSLHARPPALLVGSSTDDQPVDGSMGNAFHLAGTQFVGDSAEHRMPEVPIDAIPVMQLEMRPGADPACKFFNVPVHGLIATAQSSQPLDTKTVPGPGWLKRGSRFYHYRLKSVELVRVKPNGTPISPTLTEGNPGSNLTPVTWWDRRGATSPGVDNEAQLALLTWQVDPTPAAAERTSSRDEILRRRWGTICQTVVESSHILWTFRDAAVGPSAGGWTLTGIANRTDADITLVGPINVTLHVSEPWRSPDPIANSLVRIESAYVFGSSDNDGRILIAPHTGLEPEPRQPDDPDFIDFMNRHPLPSLEGLGNAVRLNTQGMTWARVLLFADAQRYENGDFLVRMRDETGQIIDEQQILRNRNSKLVSVKQDLIDLWGDFEPWLLSVDSIWTAWEDNLLPLPPEGLALIVLETELDPSTYMIDLGMTVDGLVDDGVVIEKWGVLAVEAETAAERARVDFDRTRRETELDAVDGALHADQGKRALLFPNSLYQVNVAYEVAKAPADDHGNPLLEKAEVEPMQTQRFRFKTKELPPERLDPWVMASDPAPVQNFFFFEDLLRIVFATNATRKLFGAYGRELFAIARASSGNHVAPVKIPLGAVPIGSLVSLLALPGMVLSPFDSQVRELLTDQECRNFNRDSDTHELVTLKLPLEPQTDYILDMEARTLAGAVVPPADPLAPPLYRLHFTTSRYPTFRALAQAVARVAQATRMDRWLADNAPLKVLAVPGPGKERSVPDSELENALRAVGWGDLSRPSVPRVTVIWIGDPAVPPTPYAVLIETPEPLWRLRGVPAIVSEPPGVPNGTKRYRLEAKLWLGISDPGALVSCFLHSTAGDRTLVVLGPNARGATLSLDLRRSRHPLYEGTLNPDSELLLRVPLLAAPWEESA